MKKVVEKYASVKNLTKTPLDSSSDEPVDEHTPEPASAAESHSTDESTKTEMKLVETEMSVMTTGNEKQQKRKAQTVDDKDDLDRLLDEVESMFWPKTKTPPTGDTEVEKEPDDKEEEEGEGTYSYEDSDWESTDESDAEEEEKEENTKSSGSEMQRATGK